MAFTVSQQLDICTILEVELPVLEYALTFNVQYIDATAETKVIAELTRWETAGSNFVKVHPRERNYGVEINSENEKEDIRRNIATLLLMTETVYGGSGSGSRAQVQILRG
jgi:hypothetical protein